ncbi:DNA topoisomerase I [Symmachiella dynata]|uniref:DNA topoisomerase I n=1 Tax=Symmachiella dynata TaxID=2527995 RepID=UPI0030ECCFF5
MGYFFRYLFKLPPARAAVRFLLGVIAIPTFRLFLRKVVRLQDLDAELEKDLEQWFRASLVLLAVTANMEHLMFDWITGDHTRIDLEPLVLGGRILIAVGVIETMPDQELFAIIYPGPPHLKFRRGQILSTVKEHWRPYVRGLICQHINRSSPVFAIMAAIFAGPAGWVFYVLAIIQYLIIGLVTSRDHAMSVLSEFDKQVTNRRRELIEEFDLDESDTQVAATEEQTTAEEAPTPDGTESDNTAQEPAPEPTRDSSP